MPVINIGVLGLNLYATAQNLNKDESRVRN